MKSRGTPNGDCYLNPSDSLPLRAYANRTLFIAVLLLLLSTTHGGNEAITTQEYSTSKCLPDFSSKLAYFASASQGLISKASTTIRQRISGGVRRFSCRCFTRRGYRRYRTRWRRNVCCYDRGCRWTRNLSFGTGVSYDSCCSSLNVPCQFRRWSTEGEHGSSMVARLSSRPQTETRIRTRGIIRCRMT